MDFVGLIPAAGRATRLAPFRYPKELLPIGYELTPQGGARPRAVAEYGVEAIKAAGIDHLFFVVAPWKLDVVTYFGDGGQFGVSVGYLYQEEARGLPHAVDIAYPWIGGRHVALVLPDTIVTPADALARLRTRYLDTGADLALAVFPTEQSWRLGPVVLSGGKVERVLDKPRGPAPANTWGAAIWGERFAGLLHEGLAPVDPAQAGTAQAGTAQAGTAQAGTAQAGTAQAGTEPVLGMFFDLAVRRGLKAVAVEFPGGSFEDAGTSEGIVRTGLVAPGMAGWPGSERKLNAS
jgi:glucose-1-phosphate thymidylyltransferase